MSEKIEIPQDFWSWLRSEEKKQREEKAQNQYLYIRNLFPNVLSYFVKVRWAAHTS